MSPDNQEYAYRLGKAYLKLAEWSFEHLKAADPDSARLAQALGEQYLAQGRADFALRAFERAARLDPSLVDVHLALARIHLNQGRLDEASRETARALALAPESAAARELQAAVDSARGRP